MKFLSIVRSVPFMLTAVALIGGLGYYFVWPSYSSRIIWAAPEFSGIDDALSTNPNQRDLRILVVHGIGDHCIGYSDELTRGILGELGIQASQNIDAYLEDLIDKARSQALEAVSAYREHIDRYREANGQPSKEGPDIEASLDDLANGLMAGVIPLAPDTATEPGPPLHFARRAAARKTRELHEFVKYGFVDSSCNRLRMPESVADSHFDSWSNRTARRNSCIAMGRDQTPGKNLDCQRITLDFYEGEHLMRLASANRDMPDLPRNACDAQTASNCVNVVPRDLGFIFSRTIRLPQADGVSRAVKIYELTWDAATRWAKYQYTSHDNQFDRDWINGHLKLQVINDSISDAVMYLGNSRPLIQYPLLAALCKIVTDRIGPEGAGLNAASGDRDEFRCSAPDLPPVAGNDFAENNELVIITHSLGTRVLFDTLGLLSLLEEGESLFEAFAEGLRTNYAYISPDDVKLIEKRFAPMRAALMGSLRKIFVLTNQIPLIEMSSLNGPVVSELPILDLRDIGRNFDQFVAARAQLAKEPLQLVAFTDPNDLLSYSLHCWYQRYVLRGSPEVQEQLAALGKMDSRLKEVFLDAISNCKRSRPDSAMIKTALDSLWRNVEERVRIAEVSVAMRSVRLPGIFADPAGVHSNYFRDSLINRLIACGAGEGDSMPESCSERGERMHR